MAKQIGRCQMGRCAKGLAGHGLDDWTPGLPFFNWDNFGPKTGAFLPGPTKEDGPMMMA